MDPYFPLDEDEHVISDVILTDDRGIGRKIDFLDNLCHVQQFLRRHASEQRYVLKKRDSINRHHKGALTHVAGILSSAQPYCGRDLRFVWAGSTRGRLM